MLYALHTVTQRMTLVKQELPTLEKNISSTPTYCGGRVVKSLVFCVKYALH